MKIFADCADLAQMHEMVRSNVIKGFTTNPTLMAKAGVKDYTKFATRVLASFPDMPISFEVFADDLPGMEAQAREIASWADNIFVKIPVTNTQGESTCPLIAKLAADGIKVNVTAILCSSQVDEVMPALGDTPAIVSIFAGRIADTGRRPQYAISHALQTRKKAFHEILWASPRQVLDVYTADNLGCDIITVTKEILDKLKLEGKNLVDYSLDTVKMFYNDAKAAGFKL